MNFPGSYRGILRLAKKHNVKLTPRCVTHDIKTVRRGCILSLVAYENGFNTYIGNLKHNPNQKLDAKSRGLEAGFENYPNEYFGTYKNLYERYYKVGKKLREYYLANMDS